MNSKSQSQPQPSLEHNADSSTLLMHGSLIFAVGIGVVALMLHAGLIASVGLVITFILFAYCVIEACNAFRAWRATGRGAAARTERATELKTYALGALFFTVFLALATGNVLLRITP